VHSEHALHLGGYTCTVQGDLGACLPLPLEKIGTMRLNLVKIDQLILSLHHMIFWFIAIHIRTAICTSNDHVISFSRSIILMMQ